MNTLLMTNVVAIGLALAHVPAGDQATLPPGVVKSEFIYEKAPFTQCHAATIAQTKDGLIAAWFGGTHEGAPDVGIWVSRYDSNEWQEPVEVATGKEKTKRLPCWNPVLFQPKGGPLMLFYKVGPDPRKWWGMFTTSTDGGLTWGEHQQLGDGFVGPVKNKPVELADGTLLCPSSTELGGWLSRVEIVNERGKAWTLSGLMNPKAEFSAIQPTLLVWPTGRIQALCRTKDEVIGESWSGDGGKSWTPLMSTKFPNPNSGIDAVMLKDGRALLVYNHTTSARTPLNVALSPDGKTWQAAVVLEKDPGEYSYPAVIQTSDRLVHIAYTWKRQRIKHVVLDPSKLQALPFMGTDWPKEIKP